MYDDYEIAINKDINVCFLSGTIISKPDFNFFYNSRKLISKAEFCLKTELGFNASNTFKSTEVKMFAYNEKADFIYKELDIGDKIMIKGFLEKDRIIIEDVFFNSHLGTVLFGELLYWGRLFFDTFKKVSKNNRPQMGKRKEYKMEILLEGKSVAENIRKNFETRLKKIKQTPNVAVLGIKGDEASLTYIKKIEKNCSKYGIKFTLKLALNEEEFIKNFEEVKQNDEFTGIMFQQPLPKKLFDLINEIPPEKDIEGISNLNMGKLFVGEKDVNIPCTSKAVIEILDFYNIDLTGKNVTIVGRSNIVGKPLIPQLLNKNATVTICHSKTKNIDEVLKKSDIIIMAIGKAKFLKKDMIKENAIIIDVGINFEDGKMVGDVDFEDVKERAMAITPVPGGVGCVTNCLLIDNIIKSMEMKKN